MPLVSAEEQKKQQERGKAYTTVTGGELGAANQQEQTQRQTKNVNERIPTGGIQFSKPSEPLDLSRGQVPFMAQGFTPKGEPYYGGGVKGYLRGAFARIFDPEPLQEGFNQQQRDAIKSASQETTQKVVEALPFLSDYKEYVNAYTTSALSAAESPGKLLGQAGKVAKEALFGGLTVLGVGEKPFRAQFSAQAAFGDIAQSYGETQTVMPKLKKYGDWRDFFTQNAPVTVSQNLHRIAEGKRAQGENFNAFLADTGATIAALPVLGPISPQLATWLGEKSLDKVETQRFNSYMKGSRMIYSLAIDEGKKQEYIRRVEEGANVDFLIEEMQNPWAELAGGLVFDMLNFLPSPAKSSRLASAGDEFAKIVDPDIAKAVEAGTKVFADDDVLPIAQKVSKVITDRIAQASEKMVSWGQAKHAYSIFNPTASSKQYLVSRRVGTVLEFIGKNASSADEGAEVASMMLRAAKGSQDAQAYLLKSKYAHMIFSQAGVDTMAMLGKLSDELGDTAKFLERLKGTSSADELLQILSPAMTKTIENMLPSLGDMRNAEKAVAAGTATAIEKNMAAQLKDVGPAIKAAEAVNQKLGKVYAPINRFFAGVYMGLSPGYAFRNLMSDTMAVFTDQGAVSAAKNIGGNIGDLFSKGAVTQRRIDDLAKLGISAPSAALAGKGAHAGVQGAEKSKKFLGIFPDMRAVAESFEQGSSVNIFANAVEREMKRAVKSGILPDLSPLREQGVTKEAVDELLRLTLKHKGNVKSAVKEWKQFATDGKLLMRKQIPLAENARGLLSQFGLESKLDDLLDSTPDEFRRGVDEIREALAKHAEKVTAAEAHTSDEAAQELVNFEQALLDFKDETIPLDERLFRARRQALNNTISSTDAAFQEAIKHMEVNGLPIADLSTRAMQEMRSRFDEVANRTRIVTDSIFNKTDGLFYRSRKMNGDELKSAWNGVKIHGQDLGDVPELLTGEAFRNAVYDLWKDKTKREWTKAGDNYFENLYGLVKDNAPDFDKIFASETWQKAASNVDEMHYWTDLPSWDQAVPNWMNRTLERINSIPDDVPLTQIRAWELRNQGWTRGRDGLVNLVNKVTGNEGRDVEDIPLKEALRVLQDWRLEYAKSGDLADASKAIQGKASMLERMIARQEEISLAGKLDDPNISPEELAQVQKRMQELGNIANPVPDEVMNFTKRQLDNLAPPAPPVEDAAPGLPRQLYEQMNQFSDDIGKWSDEVLNRWDETQPAFSNPEIDKVLSQVSRVGEQRFEQAKAFATAVGVSERDFALHKYGDKTYLDVIAGYVFPYQYWYSRSTPKWLRRVVEDPAVIAAYGKYRRTLEGLHAGMPDWWKYNLSTNDLPGVDMENPLYFNLEATLNPVNGITGVDFNDKTKRATWYARLVDDLGKFGPSTFTPISWLVAAGLYNEGETEAAERWMGRFIPATSTLKSVLNLANVDTPLPYNEIDPFVQIFSGGLDPYERRRVGRALSGMVDGVNVTEEMAIDAAYRQSGDLWDQAFQISSDDRALGQISSFAFGVGFKGRKESDIQIDNFYDEYFNLKDMYFGDIISPAEYKDQLAYLGDKYPFMNTVLLSRRAGEDRETAYSFNVLSRIPPGMSEITQEFGITSEELGAFWDDPYAIDKWDKAKRDRFLGSMYEMSAALQLPDLPTRLDWNAARNTYSAMNDQLKDEFGDKILEGIEYFYNEKDKDTARLYLDAHPEVADALDRKTQLTILTPNLMKYYGGMDTLDRYLTSKMYDNLEEKYGSDITRVSQEYSDAKYRMFNDELADQIMRENPNLKAYWKDKAIMRDDVTRKVGLFGSKIEEVRPTIRPDYAGNYKAPEPTSFEEWRNVLGDPILQALDNYVRGGNLPKNVKSELDYMAGKYGFGDPYEMASEVLASHVSNTGIPDAYIARDIVNTTPPAMFELIQSGGELPQIVIQQLQEMGGSYGISPEEVLQILLSVQ